MTAPANNIRFNYLYRDAGNYKIFGSEVFANPDGLKLGEIQGRIKALLIDGEFFDPVKWKIKTLCFPDFIDEEDHSWNEFDSIEFTSQEPTSEKSIGEFLEVARFFWMILKVNSGLPRGRRLPNAHCILPGMKYP